VQSPGQTLGKGEERTVWTTFMNYWQGDLWLLAMHNGPGFQR
jgi:hypothetical protein